MDAANGKIGYIVNAFPVVSETFLVNELRALELGGVRVAIFALTGRQDRVRHAAIEELAAERHYPPPVGPMGWLRALRLHLSCATFNGRAYGRLIRDDLWRPFCEALGHAMRLDRSAGEPTPWRKLRKRVRLFQTAVWVADEAARAGVVHLHAYYAKDPLEIAARVGSLSNIPFSFAAHAKDLYTTSSGRLARRLRKARFAVTCHRHGEQTLRGLAAPEDAAKVLRVPHGLDTKIFRPAPLPKEPDLVLAVGRLTPKKGFDTLVQACGLLRDQGRRFRCVILGEGRVGKQLARMIEQLDLGHHVTLHDFVPQQELPDWYRRACMLVLPARVLSEGNRDGIPNVALESLATGTPVVSTPVGGIPEILHDGENGLVVPPDDPPALASAMARLLDDSELAQRLGRAGLATAAGQDFRDTNGPLVQRFAELTETRLAQSLQRVSAAAWGPAGIAAKAAKRLGRTPQEQPQVEKAIADCVMPGLRANAWRRDLDRMIRKRLWDEVYKARRVSDFLGSLGHEKETERRLRVLDLGCGRGGLTVAMRARGLDAFALDVRHRNCRATRQRARRYDLEVPACAGVAERLPFREDSFDLVCALEVLEHVRDPELLLREAHRVCKPGGSCVVTVVNRWAHLDPHYRLWGVNFMPRSWAHGYIRFRGRSKTSWRDNQTLDDMHYYSFGSFRRFASSIGFDVVDPELPGSARQAFVHRVARRLSVGFNTATLVLVPR